MISKPPSVADKRCINDLMCMLHVECVGGLKPISFIHILNQVGKDFTYPLSLILDYYVTFGKRSISEKTIPRNPGSQHKGILGMLKKRIQIKWIEFLLFLKELLLLITALET